mgnify:CR=1 FL=1
MASFADLKAATLRLATNLRGWKTRRKLLVIESDDWGAIRMPGPEAWARLLKAGIRVDRSRYDSLDCLETRDDFQALMNVINDHRDVNGRPAAFTFNTVMGNPEFKAIEADEFRRFHHQHLFESYRYYHGESLETDWRKAMDADLIRPQFHAREHLNVPLWMADLKKGHSETRLAFKNGFYGLTTQTSSLRQKNYLAAFWAESQADLDSAKERLESGIELFRTTFGYDSQTFIPCNYVFPAELELVVANDGIRLIQGQRGQVVPKPLEGAVRIRRSWTGQKSSHGLLYTVRNVMFEPFEQENVDWVARAIRHISVAFRLRTPAIVSTHRVNYVAGMSKPHRDNSLRLLDRLLAEVRNRWPDIEFITSDELLAAMERS